jgi:phosphatidylglycerophosphatase A
MVNLTIQDRAGLADRVALIIATGFGLGYFPVAPGTIGSFLGIILVVLFSHLKLVGEQRLLFHLFVVTLMSIAGIWAASRTEVIFHGSYLC